VHTHTPCIAPFLTSLYWCAHTHIVCSAIFDKFSVGTHKVSPCIAPSFWSPPFWWESYQSSMAGLFGSLLNNSLIFKISFEQMKYFKRCFIFIHNKISLRKKRSFENFSMSKNNIIYIEGSCYHRLRSVLTKRIILFSQKKIVFKFWNYWIFHDLLWYFHMCPEIIPSVAHDNYEDFQLHIFTKKSFHYFEDYLMTKLTLG